MKYTILLLFFSYALWGQTNKKVSQEQVFDETLLFQKQPGEAPIDFIKRVLPTTYKLRTNLCYEAFDDDTTFGKAITFYYEKLPLSATSKQVTKNKIFNEIIFSPIDSSGKYKKISNTLLYASQITKKYELTNDSLSKYIHKLNLKETLLALNKGRMDIANGGSYIKCTETGQTTFISLWVSDLPKSKYAYANCFNLRDVVIELDLIDFHEFTDQRILDINIYTDRSKKNWVIPKATITDEKKLNDIKSVQNLTCNQGNGGNMMLSFGYNENEIREMYILFKHLQKLTAPKQIK